MQWVFQQIAEGKFNTEQIWRAARAKGLKCGKNNFWFLIRNPVYCGKIFIPKLKDEEARFAQGQHEPLISEALFYEAQDVLDGRKKNHRTKMYVDDKMPLRGFLLCPRCGRTLSGSGSKGRKKRYFYYHCNSACGARFPIEAAHREMTRELAKYIPHPAATELYKQLIAEALQEQAKDQRSQKKGLIAQVTAEGERITKARSLLLAGDIDALDFKTIKVESEKQIAILEAKLNEMKEDKTDNKLLVNQAVDYLAKLDKVYQDGPTIKKRQLIGSIFPEKLTFDGEIFRTTRLNEAVQLIYTLDTAFRENKNGTSDIFCDLSRKVAQPGFEPRHKDPESFVLPLYYWAITRQNHRRPKGAIHSTGRQN